MSTSPSVVIVLDVSGSLGSSEVLAQSVAVVTDIVTASPEARVAVVSIGGRARLVADWETPPAQVIDVINQLDVGGSTPLHDGLVLAADVLRATVPQGDGIMVVIGDGADSGQGASLKEALTALAYVEVWAVEVSTQDTDRDRLLAVVGDRGGRLVQVDDVDGRAVLLERLATSTTDSTVPVTAAPAPTTDPVATTASPPVPSVTTLVPVAGPPVPPSAETSQVLLAAGGVSVFLGVTLVIAALWPRDGAPSGVGAMATRLSTGAERLLTLAGRRRDLSATLDAAGLALRPGEAVMGLTTFAVSAGLIAGAVSSVTVGLIVTALVVAVSSGVVRRRISRRQQGFAEQLPDVLISLSSALRAGYALPQALDAVSRHLDSPAREELSRIVSEIRLGRVPGEALSAAAVRTGSRDFAWAVTAMEIHREVGGDLAVIFDNVAQTARERLHLAREVQALTAEGRVSALVLTLLPPGLVVMLSLLSPGYLDPLRSGVGLVLLIVAAGLMAFGWWWMRLLVRSGVKG